MACRLTASAAEVCSPFHFCRNHPFSAACSVALQRLLQVRKHGEMTCLVKAKYSTGHAIVANHSALGIEGKGYLQVTLLGRPFQTLDMPLQFPRIQSQPFRNYQRLRLPLLDIESQ